MFVAKPSHLHASVGAIEEQYVMYYLNIVLKWEVWINIPQGTAEEVCWCLHLLMSLPERWTLSCSGAVFSEVTIIALTSGV